MVDAIYEGSLESTLSLDKWKPENGEELKPYFIRHHLNEIRVCIAGEKFDRKLFKFVAVDRDHFMTWCQGQGIPLPGFWFPPDWKLDCDLPNR